MKKQSNTEKSISLRIVLVAPSPGVDFGIQAGKGSSYKTIQVFKYQENGRQLRAIKIIRDNTNTTEIDCKSLSE